ncbi:hypothetical protein JZ751_020324 [Albula glossodonta]|uniref:Uncharacterized protein n=1 Tax=Albula glossodonta TaxID=121402 RepID=A0A8T2NSY5_9TELE|nr:hypothetical protein JZ751_020324 [Albula glossodonta]
MRDMGYYSFGKDVRVSIQLATVLQTPCPGKDAGDGFLHAHTKAPDDFSTWATMSSINLCSYQIFSLSNSEGPLLLDGILEAAVCKACDGLGGTEKERAQGTHQGYASLTSSVLYIPIPQPPAGKSYTSHSFPALPSDGTN